MPTTTTTHNVLIPITFDEGDNVRDVFLFPLSISLEVMPPTETVTTNKAKYTLSASTQSLKDNFIASYLRDNNLSMLLYQPLHYALTTQVDSGARVLAQWFHMLNALPREYHNKQIIVEVPLEIRMEHWEYTDTLCWNLRILDDSVERVAEQIVRDQSLQLQWTMLISHALRTQILRKINSFVTRNSLKQLKTYIDEQQEQIVHNGSMDFSITRRATDNLHAYQPRVRQMTAKEIRESKTQVE